MPGPHSVPNAVRPDLVGAIVSVEPDVVPSTYSVVVADRTITLGTDAISLAGALRPTDLFVSGMTGGHRWYFVAAATAAGCNRLQTDSGWDLDGSILIGFGWGMGQHDFGVLLDKADAYTPAAPTPMPYDGQIPSGDLSYCLNEHAKVMTIEAQPW